jgi:hypothetical protein
MLLQTPLRKGTARHGNSLQHRHEAHQLNQRLELAGTLTQRLLICTWGAGKCLAAATGHLLIEWARLHCRTHKQQQQR